MDSTFSIDSIFTSVYLVFPDYFNLTYLQVFPDYFNLTYLHFQPWTSEVVSTAQGGKEVVLHGKSYNQDAPAGDMKLGFTNGLADEFLPIIDLKTRIFKSGVCGVSAFHK